MSQLNVNTEKFDPYKNFKFKVKWDGRYVAGVSKITGLSQTTERIKYREGGDLSTSRVLPGSTEYGEITLERGVTHDPEFEKWANMVHNYKGDSDNPFMDFRKDLTIEILDERGNVAVSYKVYHCWVSEFQAMPDLDAGHNTIAIQRIKLENEGWERYKCSTEYISKNFKKETHKPAIYIPLYIEVDINIKEEYSYADIKHILLNELSNRSLSDGRKGFFHPDNFTFGKPVYLSQIYSIIEKVEGVVSAKIIRFQRWGEQPRDEIENGIIEFEGFEIARLNNDPKFPENGILKLNISGGK